MTCMRRYIVPMITSLLPIMVQAGDETNAPNDSTRKEHELQASVPDFYRLPSIYQRFKNAKPDSTQQTHPVENFVGVWKLIKFSKITVEGTRVLESQLYNENGFEYEKGNWVNWLIDTSQLTLGKIDITMNGMQFFEKPNIQAKDVQTNQKEFQITVNSLHSYTNFKCRKTGISEIDCEVNSNALPQNERLFYVLD